LESRDWERPFQRCTEIGRAARSLALYLLIDWSSSMRGSANGVKLALMALHCAAAQLALPHAITFFGAGRDAPPEERIETIVTFAPAVSGNVEWPKALIAGYEPSAGNEYLFAALDQALSDLRARPERHKIILCVHDGQPVWSGREGRDWDLSIARVHRAEQQGITVIGLFLGEDEEELRKMQVLFPRLIVTTPEQLPEKLGGMLVSLA
jgi:nitric oxide reductase activation protein